METPRDHLVFNTIMSLPEATTQAEAAFQLIDEENGAQPGDLLKSLEKLGPIKPNDKVQWRVLVPGTDKRADLIALVRQASDEKSEEGFTFYPSPLSPMVNVQWGVTGLLTPEEEYELADMSWGYNEEKTLRKSELENIKSGALTREEAAELKNALVEAHSQNPFLNLEQHSKRINELWWRARIGYKISREEWEERRRKIIDGLTELVGERINRVTNL